MLYLDCTYLKGVYVEKLAELKKQGQPVADRFREAQEWPVVREEIGQSLMQVCSPKIHY